MTLGSRSAVAGLVLFGTCTSLFAKIGEERLCCPPTSAQCPRSSQLTSHRVSSLHCC